MLRPVLNLLRDQYRNCKKRLTDWKMNSSTRRRNSRLSQMNLTKPSLRCLAIKLYPNFQDDCSKQKLLFVTPTSLHTISAGLFLISLFSTTLHKLLVTLPANPCLSKLLSEFEKYLPNFKEQVAFFSPNKKMLLSDKASKLCLIKNLFSHSIYRGSCNDIFHFIEFSENERKIMRTLFLQMLKNK